MKKKIIIRILGLVILISMLNIIYTYTIFDNDILEHCAQIVRLNAKQDSTDIFYLAESSNCNAQSNDSIKLSISEITNLFFPSLNITAINKPASHAEMYKYWILQLNRKKRKPKAIVVTLNLRSFGATWINSEQESIMQQSIVLLKAYPNIINRFILSINTLEDKTPLERKKKMLKVWRTTDLVFPFPFKYKTVREWDDSVAKNRFVINLDGSYDMRNTDLACHYIKSYAFNVFENNPRIKDFDDIVEWCDKNNIHLYLNLLAENIEYADSLVGKELVFLMRENRDFLMKRYSKNNCNVVDNLELVSGKEFTDQTWTTEHYGYKGRMIIAKNLATALKKQFENQYIKMY